MTPTARFRYRLRHRPTTGVGRAKAHDEAGNVIVWKRGTTETAFQFRTRVTDDCIAKGWHRVVFYLVDEDKPND